MGVVRKAANDLQARILNFQPVSCMHGREEAAGCWLVWYLMHIYLCTAQIQPVPPACILWWKHISNEVVQFHAWCHVRHSAMLLSRLCAVFVSIRTSTSKLPPNLKSTMRVVGQSHSRASFPGLRCAPGVAYTCTALPAFRRRPPTGRAESFQVRMLQYIPCPCLRS